MVGSNMFHIQINKDNKGSSLPFGGVCIIATGDLCQLKDSLSTRMQRARAPRFRMIRNLHFVRRNQ